MGKRGPRPTPTAVLKLRGSWRAKNNPDEPRAEGEPEKPADLSEEAGKVWDRVVPLLLEMRVLGTIDGNLVVRYCNLTVRLRECDDKVAKVGSVIAVEGKFVVSPWMKLSLQLAQELRRLEGELGMSPSARTRIRVEREQKRNKVMVRSRA